MKKLTKKEKEFLEDVQHLQEEYQPTAHTSTEKDDSDINPTWEAEWKDFIKYDQDWAPEYFFDLMMYKLKKMELFYRTFSHAAPESLLPIRHTLYEAIRLGEAALKTKEKADHSTEITLWSNKHMYEWIEIIPCNPDDPLIKKILKEKDKNKDKVLYKTPEILEADKTGYGSYLSDIATIWCDQNEHKEFKDVIFTHCSRWDHKWNYWIWKYRRKKIYKQAQKARDKFFLYVSRNMDYWWD
jgi:hypothetical protein